MELELDAKSGLQIRKGGPGEGDAYIAREAKQYLALQPRRGDVLLDLGASIGSVAVLFAPLVTKVICLEPEPANFEILEANTGKIPNVERWQCAAVHAAVPNETRVLYVAGGKNQGLHSLIPSRGRDEVKVGVVPFEGLVHWCKPSLLKVDIEGGEYDLHEDLAALPLYVRGIALELHLTKNKENWRYGKAPALIAALEAQGFEAARKPKITAQNWATMGCWLRG